MNDETKPDGGPAFPIERIFLDSRVQAFPGMTLREYAAIHLKVPDSGTDWLDAMIRTAQRNELAARAMQALLSDQKTTKAAHEANARLDHFVSKIAHEVAGTMQKASNP